MPNSLTTSPFIKTAFVAIVLAASSISSASHAYLLTDIATQSLRTELSLGENPAYTDAVQQLAAGICPQEPVPDALLKEAQENLKKHQEELKAAETNQKKAQKAYDELDAKVKAFNEKIKAAQDKGDYKLEKELRDQAQPSIEERNKAKDALTAANQAFQTAKGLVEADQLAIKIATECKEKPKTGKQ